MGRKCIDLTGKIFNKLTVVQRDLTYPVGAGKSAYWKCLCECGNMVSIRSDKLLKGITHSCGCYSKEVRTEIFLKDLTNQRFGRLTVLKRDLDKPKGKGCFAYWSCKCDCGNIVSIRGDHLRNNTTSSCGCLNSTGEEKITQLLQKLNLNYKTQYTFPDLKGDNQLLRFDFAIFKNTQTILIEYQGEQHYRPWGNESEQRFVKRQEYDEKKRKYCNENQIPFIEITYKDFNQLDENFLLNKISEVI